MSENDSDRIRKEEPPLSILDLALLRNLKQAKDKRGKDKEVLSNNTHVDKKVIFRTLDRLRKDGYVGKDMLVTEKGFDLLNQPAVRVRDEPGSDLTSLEILLLRNVRPWSKDKALSEFANVDRATISAKLKKLRHEDYITEDYALTEKGFNTLYWESRKDLPRQSPRESRDDALRESATPIPTRTIVVQREVVKVPCRYCGVLNEIATAKTCSNCGAALK